MGVSTCISFILFQSITGGLQTVESAIRSLIIFSIAGIFWGAAIWYIAKREYGKYSKN